MKPTVSICHRYARGTTLLEVLVALALLATSITGTLHIYALAADVAKQSFQATTMALDSGSLHEKTLHFSGYGANIRTGARRHVP